jgi:cytochrome c oxidase subunit 2
MHAREKGLRLPAQRPAPPLPTRPARRPVFLRLAPSALALLLAGCAPAAVTSEGRAIHGLYDFFMYAAAGVFTIVSGLLVWSIIRYRRKNDELPKQIHGNNRLETTWTILPAILVIILIVATLRAQGRVLHGDGGDPGLTVDVTAFQWSWTFTYEGLPANTQVVGQPGQRPELVVPVSETVRVKLTSADVVHSFYVPRTLFKRQAIPGRTTTFDLTFNRTGVYPGQCYQFCGLDHGRMLFAVKVVSSDEFRRFVGTGSPSPPGGSGT